jgi:hypothetical protein
VSTSTQNALNLKANLASPAFTGTVTGISKAMVGLDNVDNTSDANKPVSTLTQTALNLKANLPYFAFFLKNGAVVNSQGQITPTLDNPQASLTPPQPRSSNQVYSFTLPSAHPQGNQYLLMVTPRTTGTGAGTFFYCTANVVSSTAFAVWCRNLASSGAVMDGEFYVRSIP